jgi:site-specific DNA-adenine methylase
MVAYNNIINRIGSKTNDIKSFVQYLPLDVEIIVEPFAGSFSVSKCFYKDVEKYEFHINDLDETLFFIYNNFEEMINIYKKLLKIFNERYINNYKEFHKYFKELEMNEHIKTYINNSYFVRGSLFKTLKKFNPNPYEIDILMDSKKTNLNYKDIFNEYQFNEKAFLFLDPPYLFSDNSGYKPQINKNDMTLIIVDILDLLKNSKCKILLIVNKLDILVYIFKDYIKGEYEKIYQLSKTKAVHLIITNY